MVQPGRPDPSEYAPANGRYVDLVPGDDALAVLAAQPSPLAALVAGRDDAWAGSYAYAPGKWTVKQIVGHVSDGERILAYRALCIARGESAALPGYEQDDYVRTAGANARTLRDLVDELTVVRQGTLALLRGLPPEAWMRWGVASGHSATVRGLAYVLAGHELHHVKILRERYLR